MRKYLLRIVCAVAVLTVCASAQTFTSGSQSCHTYTKNYPRVGYTEYYCFGGDANFSDGTVGSVSFTMFADGNGNFNGGLVYKNGALIASNYAGTYTTQTLYLCSPQTHCGNYTFPLTATGTFTETLGNGQMTVDFGAQVGGCYKGTCHWMAYQKDASGSF